VLAPPGVMVNWLPKHMVPLLAVTTGRFTTVREATAVLEDTHPTELVPVTE
jgi:hypothetical protein